MVPDLCERRGGEIAATERNDPLAVEAPAVRDGSGLRVLVVSVECRALELPWYAVVLSDL